MAAARLLLKHRPSPQNIGPRMVGCPTSQDAVLGSCVDRSDQVPADPLLWLTWSSRQNVSLCVLTCLAGMRWAWAFLCFVRAQQVADTQHNGASPAAVLALHLCTCDTELLQLVHFGTPRAIEPTPTANEQGLKGPWRVLESKPRPHAQKGLCAGFLAWKKRAMGDKGPREMHVPVLLLCFRYYTKLAPHDNRGWLDGIQQRVSCLRQIAAIWGQNATG